MSGSYGIRSSRYTQKKYPVSVHTAQERAHHVAQQNDMFDLNIDGRLVGTEVIVRTNDYDEDPILCVVKGYTKRDGLLVFTMENGGSTVVPATPEWIEILNQMSHKEQWAFLFGLVTFQSDMISDRRNAMGYI